MECDSNSNNQGVWGGNNGDDSITVALFLTTPRIVHSPLRVSIFPIFHSSHFLRNFSLSPLALPMASQINHQEALDILILHIWALHPNPLK